eukprot:8448924-Pyramimonas_sp.AAC.1
MPQSQAAFLGVDISCGVRLARATRRERDQKHAIMSAKIGRYAKAAERYRVASRLGVQGAQAAGCYGFQIYGTFGQRLLQARRRAGFACGAATRGRCLTSLLALRMPEQDPGI